ncbi:MAG: DUF4252 domain-containing protein [Candidatus Cryptobacteroides sp.]
MKKSIYIITITVCATIMCSFTSRAKSEMETMKQSIESIIDNYKGNENFEVVKIGGWMMRLAGVKNNSSANINSMIVVDYEDCSNSVKSSFTMDVLKAVKGCEKLMEVEENDERVTFFGSVAEDGYTVTNPMILSGDGDLICFFGTINISELDKLSDR